MMPIWEVEEYTSAAAYLLLLTSFNSVPIKISLRPPNITNAFFYVTTFTPTHAAIHNPYPPPV
jgi:hypothetical protein